MVGFICCRNLMRWREVAESDWMDTIAAVENLNRTPLIPRLFSLVASKVLPFSWIFSILIRPLIISFSSSIGDFHNNIHTIYSDWGRPNNHTNLVPDLNKLVLLNFWHSAHDMISNWFDPLVIPSQEQISPTFPPYFHLLYRIRAG